MGGWLCVVGHCLIGGRSIIGHHDDVFRSICHGWIFGLSFECPCPCDRDTSHCHLTVCLDRRLIAHVFESNCQLGQCLVSDLIALCVIALGEIQLFSGRDG